MGQTAASPAVDSHEPGATAAGYRDELTGLPGRPLMRERLGEPLLEDAFARASTDNGIEERR